VPSVTIPDETNYMLRPAHPDQFAAYPSEGRHPAYCRRDIPRPPDDAPARICMKAVLFDLDGTLLDTLQDIADACNAALGRHGFPPHPVDRYRYFVGDGVPVLVSRAVPVQQHTPDTLDSVAAAYREEYQRRWNATTTLYPGIAELLDELTHRGVPMAVLSNKPDDSTRHCVAEFLPRWTFSIVLGASKAFPPKPDPAGARHIARTLGLPPDQFGYLGDTPTDMRTAVGAEMFPVGVLWGFRKAAELKAAGARQLISHPRELLKLEL
jgi:phosphoglycolate phosphatase